MTSECSKSREHVTKRQNLNRHMLTRTEKSFDCAECGKNFSQRLMLMKHRFTHSGERPFRCSVCGDKFFVRCEFEAHKLLHVEDKQISCHEFGNKFIVKQGVDEKKMLLTREEQQLQTIESVQLIPDHENFNAGPCQNSVPDFETNYVSKFLKTDSKGKVDPECRCSICGNVYRSSKSLKRHSKTCGRAGSLNKTKCLHPSCERKFFHITKMIHHLENDHSGMKIDAKEINFPSIADFRKWKEEEELKTFSYFSRSSGKTCLKGGVYTYYTCQHDGLDRFHCKAGEAGRTTNRKWVKGRVKTGITCPSRMLVKEFNSGTVSVKYISTHSHEVKFENTKYQPLSSSTLSFIKEQLALGVPPRKIQEKLHDGLDDYTQNGLSQALRKEQFVSMKQLDELRRKLKMNSRVDSDDAASVASLVKKMEGSHLNPFVTYKPQGGSVVIGDSDLDTLPYAKELFAVALQTEQQMKIMRDGATRMMYVEFFNFDSVNEFTLLNLIVPDEFGNFYPIAHFITNHKDEKTLSCLFTCLRGRCPNLRIKVVITGEKDSSGVTALKAVFGYMRTLLCQGKIRKIWLQKLQATVKNTKTRDEVLSALNALLYEKNKECFQQMCSSFTGRFGPVIPDFINYFTQDYLSSSQIWASCYRILPDPDIDTTTCFLSFHNKLRRYDSKKKFDRKISDLIVLLLEIEKENFLQFEENLRCDLQSAVVGCPLTGRHAKGHQIPDSDVMVSKGAWRVVSQHNRSTFYVVNCTAQECRQDLCFEKCTDLSCSDLCPHMFTCSCQDVSGLCKHIHKVRLLTLQQMCSPCQVHHEQMQEACYELKQEVCIEQGEEMYCEHSQEAYSEPVQVYCEHPDDVYSNQVQDVYTTEIYSTKIQSSEKTEVQDDESTEVEDSYDAEVQSGYNTDVQDVCSSHLQGACTAQTKDHFCTVRKTPKVNVELCPVPYTDIVMHCKDAASPTVTAVQDAASPTVTAVQDAASPAVTAVQSEYVSSHTETGVQCPEVLSYAVGAADCENILSQVGTNVGCEECNTCSNSCAV